MRTPRCSIPLVLAALVSHAGIGWTGHASAATILVTTTSDDFDLGPNGTCSLREAVLSANGDVAVDGCTAGSGPDVIEVPAGLYTLTIPGENEDGSRSGDLDVTGDLVIRGEARDQTTLRGGVPGYSRVDRLFHVLGGVKVILQDLTVRDSGPPAVLYPPLPGSGGAILNQGGDIVLTRVALLANSCASSSLWSYSNDLGGAVYQSAGSLTLEDSVVDRNACVTGGGIAVDDGTLTLVRTSITRNVGSPRAGGVFLGLTTAASLSHSSVVRNSASSYDGPGSFWPGGVGGGIYNVGAATLDTCTVAMNSVSWGFPDTSAGDGIYNLGSMVLRHSTVARNSLAAPGNPSSSRAIQNDGPSASASLEDVVVGGGCVGGGFTSAGFNIEAGSTCNLTDASDLPDTDPLVGAAAHPWLGSDVVALLPGSSAIDSGPAAGQCPVDDQVGTARPIDGDGDGSAACDRGAVEMPFSPDTDGDGYRDAIDDCPLVADPAQTDQDFDGLGDACDGCNDTDEDGYGNPASVSCPHPENDCNDALAFIHPGAAEILDNDRDDDCNPATPDCTDADGDQYPAASCPHPNVSYDCDDSDPAVHPGAVEIPGNGIDDDCNPATPAGCFGAPGPQDASAAVIGQANAERRGAGADGLSSGLALLGAVRMTRRALRAGRKRLVPGGS